MFDEAELPQLTECGHVVTNVSDVLILHSPGDPFFQLGCVSKFGQQDLEGDTGIQYMIRYADAVRKAKKMARHRRIFLIDPRAQRWVEIASHPTSSPTPPRRPSPS